ncbi:MAG: NAD kinase [Bacteroidaceae bacterium]|nr:NAD kinase [Bacteroidaceae bacterium]MBR3444128.1 NAD kinase [Bacteroidaceae bacterium]
MAERKLRFALFGNTFQERKAAAVQKLLAVLSAHGADLSVEATFYAFMTEGLQIRVPECRLLHSNDFEADFVVCMGGDGTFLDVASRVGSKQTPIIGFNMGHLGFLASFSPDDIEAVVAAVYSGDYRLEDHSVLQLSSDEDVLEGYPFALNEIAILKHDISSMIKIHTHINGEYLTTYQADGLIVGTPTGSTAYSLSVGGPIVVPQSQTMTLTPVAPHSLNMRPIVLCDDSEVELTVESRSHHFLVSVDGRSRSYDEGIHLRIRRAPYGVKVLVRPDHSYFSTLRRKMMWGADRRNR